MRVAYADPPYVGCASYYGDAEIDHPALIVRLVAEYPDGWALSCHTPSLRMLLPLCPEATRVCAWVKGWASFKPGVHPAYAWEPLLVFGGRKPPRSEATVRDWHKAHATTGRDFIGAKPASVAFWLFGLLGLRAGDEFVDLFPGTGAMTRAWDSWCRQTTLTFAEAADGRNDVPEEADQHGEQGPASRAQSPR